MVQEKDYIKMSLYTQNILHWYIRIITNFFDKKKNTQKKLSRFYYSTARYFAPMLYEHMHLKTAINEDY